jgi:hypothetical protein
MNIHELPKAWREHGLFLRKLAAMYPKDHALHCGLMDRVGTLTLCARDLEGVLREMGGQAEGNLSLAIEAVEAGLQATRRQLPPDKKAALVLAAYELICGDWRRPEKMEKKELTSSERMAKAEALRDFLERQAITNVDDLADVVGVAVRAMLGGCMTEEFNRRVALRLTQP